MILLFNVCIMQLDLNEEKMLLLLKHLVVTNNIIWVLADEYWEEYEKLLDQSDDLINDILSKCDLEICKKIVKQEDGKNVLSEDFYEESLEIFDEYEDFSFVDNLAFKIAEKETWDVDSEEFEKKYIEYKNKLIKNWFSNLDCNFEE